MAGDRHLEMDPTMKASRVVVLDELSEYALEMAIITDEEPI